MTDILGSVVEGIAQIPGTAFLHVRITVFKLPGLVGRGGHPGVSQQFVGGIKAGKVTGFGEAHSAHAVSNAWNSGNGRVQLIHNGLDRSFNFFNNSRDLAGILEPIEHLAASRISTAISLP